MRIHSVLLIAATALLFTGQLPAQVPNLLNYQGRVAVGTPAVNFDGAGQFKFALVNADGTTTHWSNDGTSTAGSQPTAAVPLTVTKGLYSVLLGDTSLGASMTAIPASVFANADVRLRVWFNDGATGFQLLSPDQRLAPSGYLPDGAVTSGKMADGSVTSAKIANGAVGNPQIAANAVQAGNLAAGSIGSAQLADGAVTDAKIQVGAVGQAQLAATAVHGEGWGTMATLNAPSTRFGKSAVWTEAEWIIWGGYGSGDHFNDGARFNPAANTWAPTTTAGAASARGYHTAIWTGVEMIVWGGYGSGGPLGDGARYNPTTNTWSAMATAGAASARGQHTAIWTGYGDDCLGRI